MNKDDLTEHAEKYLALLPPWRTERYHRMKIESGKLEELAAGLLLRYALRDAAGIDLLNAEMTKNPHGKPELKMVQDSYSKPEPAGGQIHFNLSHSDGYIAAAVADCPVGIDVETNVDRDGKIAKRFFSEEEQQAIRDAEDPQLAFRRIWTRKEAYVKCTGTGIGGAIDQIPGLADRFGAYSITTLREGAAYTLSLAIQSPVDDSRIVVHDVDPQSPQSSFIFPLTSR